MLPVTVSQTTAPHWTPKLRRWLMGIDTTNVIILALDFLFGLSNGIQKIDNYRNWRGLSIPESTFATAVLCLAIIPPAAGFIWLWVQRFLYSRKTLAPWMALTASLVLLGMWAVVCFFSVGTGPDSRYMYSRRIPSPLVDFPYQGEPYQSNVYIGKREPQQPSVTVQSTVAYTQTAYTYSTATITSTPTRTVVSLASPTQTFISALPYDSIIETKPVSTALQRDVPVNEIVYWIWWGLNILAAILQLFYMSVAARAIDNAKKARKAGHSAERGTANITYYEPADVADTLPRVHRPATAAYRGPPASDVPSLPPWSPPRSRRGSFMSSDSVDGKTAYLVAESLR